MYLPGIYLKNFERKLKLVNNLLVLTFGQNFTVNTQGIHLWVFTSRFLPPDAL